MKGERKHSFSVSLYSIIKNESLVSNILSTPQVCQEMFGPFSEICDNFRLFIVHIPFKYCQKGIKKNFF